MAAAASGDKGPAVAACGRKRCLPAKPQEFVKSFTLRFWLRTLPSAGTSAAAASPGGAGGRLEGLASRRREQGRRCCPLGRVPCFPHPPKRDLQLCWFLGSFLGGGAWSSILEESVPQTCCPASTARGLRAVSKAQCLFCSGGDPVLGSVSLCLVTGCESFLPPRSCLKLFQILGTGPFCWSLGLVSGSRFDASPQQVEVWSCCTAAAPWPFLSGLVYAPLQEPLLLSNPHSGPCSLTDICGWPIS